MCTYLTRHVHVCWMMCIGVCEVKYSKDNECWNICGHDLVRLLSYLFFILLYNTI